MPSSSQTIYLVNFVASNKHLQTPKYTKSLQFGNTEFLLKTKLVGVLGFHPLFLGSSIPSVFERGI